MNKTEMVKASVRLDVWQIFRRVYGITAAAPSSEKQEELLSAIGDYVAKKLAPSFTREELEQMLLDKNRPV